MCSERHLCPLGDGHTPRRASQHRQPWRGDAGCQHTRDRPCLLESGQVSPSQRCVVSTPGGLNLARLWHARGATARDYLPRQEGTRCVFGHTAEVAAVDEASALAWSAPKARRSTRQSGTRTTTRARRLRSARPRGPSWLDFDFCRSELISGRISYSFDGTSSRDTVPADFSSVWAALATRPPYDATESALERCSG